MLPPSRLRLDANFPGKSDKGQCSSKVMPSPIVCTAADECHTSSVLTGMIWSSL